MFTIKSLSLTLFFLTSWFYLLSPAVAQVNSTDTPDFQPNEYDALTGPGGINPMDLIHRANMSTSRNQEEFQSDSQNQIDDAASEFKRQQQEHFQNQTQTQTEAQ
jgi:hypothetical protein